MDGQAERELWIVGREFERPPYFHAGKGGDTRLARALRVCVEGRITPNSDGSYTVEGSEKRTYRVADGCSCPQSQQGKSRWCYHAVAVAVYIEWQRRLRPPIELGTLRAGTLPLDDPRPGQALPPTSVDERLAQAASYARDHAFDALPEPTEDRMPDDDTQYITEPDDIAVMDEPEPTPPAPIKIPREFTVQIKGRTHVLYTGLVIAARANGLVTLCADWTYNDAELSLAHAVCTFADGRRYEESGDASPGNVSKGISLHFRRVALTRAKARCLRDALGISECSVEELADDSGKAPVPDMSQAARLSEKELVQRIWAIVKQRAPEAKTREQVDAWILKNTGLALHPDEYADIVATLETRT